MFIRTTAINKVLKMKARKKVIRGGSSAGKTFAILPILIDKCCKTDFLEVSVISESIPHLKKGALKDFIKIMRWTGRWIEANYNATDRKYTFTNGSYIEFFSPESVLGSRRNILYINEANNILYEDYMQLAMRTSGEIYLDYNPAEEFWADTEILSEPNSELLVLTYKDNEARPANVDEDFATLIDKANKEAQSGLPITSYFQNYVRVYVYGLIGNLQGVVFNNWKKCEAIPNEAELLGYGMDFGFTNDPTALVAIYKYNGELYLDELLYERGLTNPEIVSNLAKLGVNGTIVADSSDPKSIAEIDNLWSGNIVGAVKGADSIRSGIDKMQTYQINVTSTSTNLIKEFRNYRWKVDKSGKSMNEPVDHSNHAIDAVRYGVTGLINQEVFAVY
jgi:phage terminase large subunit